MKNHIPAIDGLRALAIILVVSYHYFPEYVEFGFLGVDIFFVISGYVITYIILSELSDGKFKIKKFFVNRIRRLAPAILVTVLLTLLISSFIMLPSDLKSLAKASIANLVGSQNFLFSSSVGYFDTSIRSSPILHTWSLAVEAQFYLLAPLFVIIVERVRKKYYLLLLCLISVISFTLVTVNSETHPAAIFYLLPFRIFELLAGVLLAVVRNEPHVISVSRKLPSMGFTLAIILLVFSCASFDAKITFPNVTVLPVLASAVSIILYADSGIAKLVLGNRLMVAIGKLSFSIYLYHYPILKLAENYKLRSLGMNEKLLLLVITLVMSWCSFRFLERRYRILSSVRELSTVVGLLCILVAVLSAIILMREGYTKNFDLEQRRFLKYYDRSLEDPPYLNFTASIYGYGDCQEENILRIAIANKCYFPAISDIDSETVILWGDSHAHHLVSGIRKNLAKNVSLLLLTMNGCRPEIPAERESAQSLKCQKHNKAAVKTLQRLNGSKVVISTVQPPEYQELENLLLKFRKISPDSSTLFVGPAPSYVAPFPEIFINRFWNSREVSTSIGLDESAERREKRFKHNLDLLGPKFDVQYFSLYTKMCPKSTCQFRILPDDRQIFIWDYSHLSIAGSSFVGKDIVRMMNLQVLDKR